METACVTMNYGEAVKGYSYRVLEHGRDFKKVSCRGKVLYVPCWAFDRDNLHFTNEPEIEE